MDTRTRNAFLLLVLAQALHSIEEFATRLYEVFPPARFISGLLSSDLATGFAIANAAFVGLGLWCYLARVRGGRPSARAWMWPYVCIELGNGAGHLAIAASRGGYFPGAATAPLLLALAAYLARRLWRARPTSRAAA